MNSKKSKGSHGSRSSNASKETRSSKSLKEKEIEDKVTVAELMTEAELLQQKQMIQNEAEKLKIKERLAKAKARVQAYKNIKIEQHGNEREQFPSKTLDDSSWMKPVRKDDTIRDGMVELEQERGPAITYVEHKPRLGNTCNVPDDQDKVSLPHKGAVGKEQLQHE